MIAALHDGSVVARHVFDLERDAREAIPLAASFDDALLEQMADSHGRPCTAHIDDLRPEIRTRLRALGYVQ